MAKSSGSIIAGAVCPSCKKGDKLSPSPEEGRLVCRRCREGWDTALCKKVGREVAKKRKAARGGVVQRTLFDVAPDAQREGGL